MTSSSHPATPTLTTTTGSPLPLTDVKVHVEVEGAGHRTTVTQVFANSHAVPIEVTYHFPLPGDAAVHGCSIRIGERELVAALKELGQARREYDVAIDEGRTASLVEQDLSEAFQVQVGNIPAHCEVEVTLELHGEVKLDSNEATLRLPTLVAPRYGHDSSALRRTKDASAGTRTRVTVHHADPAVKLHCPSHLADGLGRLELTDVALDRDVIVRWPVPSSFSEARWLADREGSTDGTLEVLIRSEDPLRSEVRPKDLVILIDRSGSMGGWGQHAANSTAIDILSALPSGDAAVVLQFDDICEPLPACARRAVQIGGSEHRRLVDEVRAIQARGGTELIGALKSAARRLQVEGDDREKVLVLITDGQFGNESEAVRLRNTVLKGVRVLVIGIDMAVSGGFLTELAAGSYVELIESEARRSEVSSRICARLATPVHVGLMIEGITEPTRTNGVDVYPGQTVRLAGRCSLPADAVALHDATGTTIRIPVTVSDDVSIRTRWAGERLTVLEHAGVDSNDIVALSLAHAVQCRHTAWVVVDADGEVQQLPPVPMVVPLEEAAGWMPMHSHSVSLNCVSSSLEYDILSAPLGALDFDLLPGADTLIDELDALLRTRVVTSDLVAAVDAVLDWATQNVEPHPSVDRLRAAVARLDLAALVGKVHQRTAARINRVVRELLDMLARRVSTDF